MMQRSGRERGRILPVFRQIWPRLSLVATMASLVGLGATVQTASANRWRRRIMVDAVTGEVTVSFTMPMP